MVCKRASLGDIQQCLQRFVIVTKSSQLLYLQYHAASHPTVLRTATTAKNYLGPSVNSEEIKNPWWQAKNQKKERSQPSGGRV